MMFFGNSREWFRLGPKRPKPKFEPGQLACFSHPNLKEKSYLSISARRWIKLSGEMGMRWVYNGTVFKIENGQLVWSTYGYTIGEESLAPIPGLE